jgi:hypothetical protein
MAAPEEESEEGFADIREFVRENHINDRLEGILDSIPRIRRVMGDDEHFQVEADDYVQILHQLDLFLVTQRPTPRLQSLLRLLGAPIEVQDAVNIGPIVIGGTKRVQVGASDILPPGSMGGRQWIRAYQMMSDWLVRSLTSFFDELRPVWERVMDLPELTEREQRAENRARFHELIAEMDAEREAGRQELRDLINAISSEEDEEAPGAV